MGPKRNGSQRIGTPDAMAASSIRAAERYEYVLPNSNQNSRLDVLIVPPMNLDHPLLLPQFFVGNIDKAGEIPVVDAPGARLAVFVVGGIQDDPVILLHGGSGVPDYLAGVAGSLAPNIEGSAMISVERADLPFATGASGWQSTWKTSKRSGRRTGTSG